VPTQITRRVPSFVPRASNPWLRRKGTSLPSFGPSWHSLSARKEGTSDDSCMRACVCVWYHAECLSKS
jgi:hypothetical protein